MDFKFTYLFMTVNKNLAHLSPLRTCGCMLIINTSTQVNISGRQYSFKKNLKTVGCSPPLHPTSASSCGRHPAGLS